MIKSKKINIIVAIAIIFAILTSISMMVFASSGTVASSNSKAEYESKIFGTQIISIEIIADDADWQKMIENAKDEQFIMADVVINGTKFQNVGIRPKGNSSLTNVADSGGTRYSFRIQFDEYIKGQTAFGLDSLVVNNMQGDSSYIKEYISYDIMKEIGVDAPDFGFANIKVNGNAWGLYLAVETYGDSYEKRTFNTTSGMMYNVKSMDMGGNKNKTDEKGDIKSGDTTNVQSGPMGAPPNMQNPQNNTDNTQVTSGATQKVEGNNPPTNNNNNNSNIESTQTTKTQSETSEVTTQTVVGNSNDTSENKNFDVPNMNFAGPMGSRGSNGGSLEYTTDDVSSYSAIFGNVVGKGKEEDFKRVVSALKALSTGENLDEYFDVDQILRYLAAHTIVVNLDSYSSNMAQNYYLYEKDGKVTVLPWDYNLSWGGFQSSSASDVINFPIDSPVSGVQMSSRPLLEKLFSNKEYLDKYHSYLQELMTKYFADGKWEQKVTSLDNLISDYVKNDKTSFTTYENYKIAVEAMKKLGNLRYQSIQGQLNGTIPSTSFEQNANQDKLISGGDLNLTSLGSMMGGGNRGANTNTPPTGNAQVNNFTPPNNNNNNNSNGASSSNTTQNNNVAPNKNTPKGGMPQGNPPSDNSKMGGQFNNNQGANMVDPDLMKKAMDIIKSAQGNINDEVKQKLIALGLTEEQITMLSQMKNAPMGNQSQMGNTESNNTSVNNSQGNNSQENNATINKGKAKNTPPVMKNEVVSNKNNTKNIAIYIGLFALMSIATFFIAKKGRNY